MMYLRPLEISKEYKKLRYIYWMIFSTFYILILEICLIIYQISTLISKRTNELYYNIYELYLTIKWENNKRENKINYLWENIKIYPSNILIVLTLLLKFLVILFK